MSKKLRAIAIPLLQSILITTGCQSKPQRPDWTRFQDKEQVEAYVRSILPARSSPERVASLFAARGLSCSPLEDNEMHLLARAPQSWNDYFHLVSWDWYVTLSFKGGGLDAITVVRIGTGL